MRKVAEEQCKTSDYLCQVPSYPKAIFSIYNESAKQKKIIGGVNTQRKWHASVVNEKIQFGAP